MNRKARENGLSDVFGAMILVAVVAGAVGLISVAILSQPPPDKIPSLSSEIIISGRTVLITHAGGDTLQREGMSIKVDGEELTDSFSLMSGAPWSSWAVGDTLMYEVPGGQELPESIQIGYTSGSSANTLLSWGDSGSVTPITTATTTTTTTTTPVTTTTTPVPPLPVTAGFSGSPTSGDAPLSVQFTDESSGPVTEWSWAFGDGNTSSVQNPLYSYPDSGDWPVSLTVSNGSGTDTLTRPQYITVSTPVTGSIVLNAGKAGYIEQGGEMQLRVTGTSSSIQVNGVTYPLSQGDTVRLVMESNEYGSIYSSSTMLSTFSFDDVSFYQNGAFMNRGAVGIININGFDQYQSTLNLYMPPASASTYFSVDGTPLINYEESSLAIRITGLEPPINLAPASSSLVYYSGNAGGYQILGPQVTGITPNSGEAGTTVSITDLSGMYFAPGSSPTVKLQKGTSSITATSVTVLSSTQIQCTFNLAGAETGQWDVVVTNAEGQSGIGTALFTVIPGPLTASFTYTLPSDNVVHFTDTSTGGATTWDWDFGDGTPHSTVQNPPDHTYASAGTYTVTLTVTDGSQSSSAQQSLSIFLPATHSATLSASKGAYVELGGVVQFRVTGLYSYIVVNGVQYDFNQGDTVRLVMGSNGYGSISSSATMISTFTFDDVSLYLNDVYQNRGAASGIYVSSYDQYQSTLNLYMPSASAWTSFIFDGSTLISGTSSSAVRVTGLSGAMNLQAGSGTVYYVGSATGYTIF